MRQETDKSCLYFKTYFVDASRTTTQCMITSKIAREKDYTLYVEFIDVLKKGLCTSLN